MTKDTSRPAFPAPHFDLAEGEHGLSMRDYFAAKAMTGCLPGAASPTPPEAYARWAYRIADAMLEARK